MAKQEAAKSSLTGMLNMGMKVVNKAVGEGETQINFERNALRVSIHISHLRHFWGGGVLTQKIPKNPSRYTKIGKLGLGFFWDFLGFLNFQIGIGFFWVFLGLGFFWDFLGFFGFFKFPNWDWVFWVFLGLGFFGLLGFLSIFLI